MKKFRKVSTFAEFELPIAFSREIGRVAVHWAYLEYCIQRIVWLLVGVDETMGRYAVREPRIDDRIDMIRDLAELRSIKIEKDKLTKLKKAVSTISRNRDLLIHGTWTRYPTGVWIVRDLRGQHPIDRKEVPHRSRRIAPEAIPINMESLRGNIRWLSDLISEATALEGDLRAKLEPSPEKPA
jgi:hypothetical protein